MPLRNICCLALSLLLTGCGPDAPAADADDAGLQQRVAAALASTADLPPTLGVDVSAGVVTISGSLACEDCGGNATPGTTATIQQSLGAIVRAIPGVQRVEFALTAP